MILGRSPALWAALIQAALNLAMAAVVVSSGHDLTAAQVGLFAAANAFGVAIIAVIANESDPRTVPTFAATITPSVSSSARASSPSSLASPGSPATRSAAASSGRTRGPTAVDPLDVQVEASLDDPGGNG